jgi:hypothetical protein
MGPYVIGLKNGAMRACVDRIGTKRQWQPPFIAKRFLRPLCTTDVYGMGRTRTGLNEGPACRPLVICPGLSAPHGVAACGHAGRLAGRDA